MVFFWAFHAISAVVGIVWTLVSPVAAFTLAAVAMAVALVALLTASLRGRGQDAPAG